MNDRRQRIFLADLSSFDFADRHDLKDPTQSNKAKFHDIRSRILSLVLECNQEELAFAWTDGMPRLVGIDNFCFSTSYSGTKIAVACSDNAIGIDLELTASEPADQEVADNLFHPRELDQLRKTADADWANVFYSIWTQKEAFAKALGTGFGIEFPAFAVSANGGLIDGELIETQNMHWYSKAVKVADNYTLAIAEPGPIEQLTIEQFQDT